MIASGVLHRQDPHKYHTYKAIVCSVMLLGLGYVTSQTLYTYIGMALTFILILYQKSSMDFVMFCALIPFYRLFTVQGKNILFMVLIVASLKILLKLDSIKNAKAKILLSMATIVSIETLNDLFQTEIGRLALLVSTLVYAVVFMISNTGEEIEADGLIRTSIFSFTLAMIYIYIAGDTNVTSMDQSNYWIRIGMDTMSLGTSMDIPVYCITNICLCTVYITPKKRKMGGLIFSVAAISFSFIVGLGTVSRSFILGLFVYLFLLVKHLTKSNSKSRARLLTSAVILVGAILLMNWETIELLLSRILLRTEAVGLATGRIDIWKSCFEYMLNNPLRLLFGSGSFHYIEIGAREGWAFSRSAHNIILDFMMAWGLVGTLLFVGALFSFYRSAIVKVNRKPSILAYAVLICYVMVSMTHNLSYYYNTYFYLLLGIVIAIKFTNMGTEQRVEQLE